MIVPFPLLSVASQGKHVTSFVNRMNHVLIFSLLFASTHSKQKIVLSSSSHQNQGKHLCNYYLKQGGSCEGEVVSFRYYQCSETSGRRYHFLFTKIQEMLSRSQAFTPEDNISKSKQIYKIKKACWTKFNLTIS